MDELPAPPANAAWVPWLERERLAIPAIGVVALAWAALSWLLARDGVIPPAIWVPIEPRQYYGLQAFFVIPLMVVCAWVFSALAWSISSARRVVILPRAFQVLGVTWALPVLLLFVLPDLLVVLLAGHTALAKAMRFYGPLAPVAIVVASSRALRDGYGVPRSRAIGATIVALVVQTALAAVVLR